MIMPIRNHLIWSIAAVAGWTAFHCLFILLSDEGRWLITMPELRHQPGILPVGKTEIIKGMIQLIAVGAGGVGMYYVLRRFVHGLIKRQDLSYWKKQSLEWMLTCLWTIGTFLLGTVVICVGILANFLVRA